MSIENVRKLCRRLWLTVACVGLLSVGVGSQTLTERIDAITTELTKSRGRTLTVTQYNKLVTDLTALKAAIGQLPPTQAILDQLTRIEAAVSTMPVPAPPPAPSTIPPAAIVIVPQGGDIQTAIDAAADGTEIRIAPGTYSVNLVLRAGKSNVVLRTDIADNVVKFTAGGWIDGPAMAGALAKLIPVEASRPIVATAPNARNYTLTLLEICCNELAPDHDLVVFGDAAAASPNSQPSGIIVDRVWLHGGTRGGHRGIALQSGDTRITRSYLNDFWEIGRDSQAIAGWNGPGPYLITSNYVEASGENILFGGADPQTVGLIPSDITIRGNHFVKPLAWKTKPGSVKNLLELKNAQRVVVEDNVFDRNWADQQNGAGILLTVRNQDGGCSWCVVRNVAFRYNLVRDIEGDAFNLLGQDDINASALGSDITIEHTLCLRCHDGFIVNNGYTRLTLRQNTLTNTVGRGLYLLANPAQGLVFTNNVVSSGTYGVIGDSVGVGLPALARYAPGAIFTGNVFTTAAGLTLPAGNTVLPALPIDAQYRYTGATSPAPGADVVELRRRIPWIIF